MADASFQLDLVNTSNDSIKPNVSFDKLDYSTSFAAIGSMNVVIPPDRYNPELFGRDSMFRFYRTPVGGGPALEPKAVWLVREKKIDLDTGGISLKCVDQMDLLRRRIVAYRTQTILADKTVDESNGPDFADDLMKAYVRENMGPGVLTDWEGGYESVRDLTPYLTTEADQSLGPLVEEAASMKIVFDTLKSLREKAKESGTEVFFDIQANNDGTFLFRTLIGSMGLSRQSAVDSAQFSPTLGNLAKASLVWDWSNEVTFVYLGAGGNGLENRIRKVDSNRSTLTAFNRIETYKGEDDLNDAALDDRGAAILEAGKPRIILNAQAVDTPDTIYGIHYFYGDSVQVQAAGYKFPCHIYSIKNRIAGEKESLVIKLIAELPVVS